MRDERRPMKGTACFCKHKNGRACQLHTSRKRRLIRARDPWIETWLFPNMGYNNCQDVEYSVRILWLYIEASWRWLNLSCYTSNSLLWSVSVLSKTDSNFCWKLFTPISIRIEAIASHLRWNKLFQYWCLHASLRRKLNDSYTAVSWKICNILSDGEGREKLADCRWDPRLRLEIQATR